MTIDINRAEDWDELARRGLTTVLDPMIFRCGELFLSGPEKETDSAATWDLLDKNIHAVGMFFDYLMLAEKIPVFNYGDTFDAGLNFAERALSRINQHDEVLYDVDVQWAAYRAIKDDALAELKKLLDGPRKVIEPELAQEVLNELSVSEYKWSPNLEGIEFGDDRLTKLSQFLLGGMIFSRYAAQLNSEHVLQPKRSRLFLAVALQGRSAAHGFEDELFGELKKRANVRSDDLPWRPSFFPYLLSEADSPSEMLGLVARLRASGAVRDYRAWLAERIKEWERDGKITLQARRDMEAVARLADYGTGRLSSLPKIEVKATIADLGGAAAGVPPIPGSADFTGPLERLVGWTVSSLPGKRYRKLLSRALVEDQLYKKITNRVKTVWQEARRIH